MANLGKKIINQKDLNLMALQKKLTLNNNQGATLVEFALSSALLFMFLILGLDVLRLAYHTSTLQYVLGKGAAAGVIKASAARKIVVDPSTGNESVTMESPEIRKNFIKDEIKNLGDQFGLGIVTNNPPDEYLAVSTTITQPCRLDIPLGTLGACSESPGNSKDFVRVDFHREFPFIWGAIIVPINIYVIVKNEPF